MQHELLPAVPLILGALWIRRKERDDDHNDFLLPADGVQTNTLGHPVPLHKFQESESFHAWGGGAAAVVVQL